MKTTTNKNLEMKFSHTIGVKTLYISLLLFFTLAAGNIFAQTVIHSGVSKHPNLFGQHYERNSTDKSNLCEDFLPTNTFAVGNHQPSLPSYKKIDVAFNPLSLIHLYDSIYFWKWDTLSNGWIFNVKIINFVYDVNNNQTSSLTQLWNGSAWQNSLLYTYTYDANNNQTSSLSQGWNVSVWKNNFLYTYTYDANNNQTSIFSQEWNGSVWDNEFLYIYTYDANNNQTSYLSQYWNGSTWGNPSLSTYTYDANNNQTSSLYQLWNGSSWENTSQSTYTYDANNNQTSILSQIWNGSAWENYFLSTYTYDANNNQTSYLFQDWNGSIWDNGFQYTYTYDANNNQTSSLSQIWNGSTWDNDFQYTYTYDANNFMQSYVLKFFNSIGTISSADSAYYYFHVVNTGVNDLMSQNEGILVYPNPFGNELKISGSGNGGGEVILFDVLGKEILREKISNEETIINTEKLLPGFYLLNYTDGNKAANIKLLKF